MPHQLFSLSPLDGRYRNRLGNLPVYFSEAGLMKYRVMVEVEYLILLGETKELSEVKPFSDSVQRKLRKLYEGFGIRQAEQVKKIEQVTNHDVKAVEYFLREKLAGLVDKDVLEFIHFCCTSEDINNLAYGVMVRDALRDEYLPLVKSLLGKLSALAKQWKRVPMLSMTHGQPATPTTVGKEFWVFHQRIIRGLDILKSVRIFGKFNGASGNWNAHTVAYPFVSWKKLSRQLIRTLGLEPNFVTTQIESHDWMAELFDAMKRINLMVLDLDRDMWLYISRGILQQKAVAGEVGSSTMPHKVNPIDFENSEGNIGMANALLGQLALQLPVSRMQRDLSDSTVQRSIGVVFGYTHLALRSTLKGLGKMELNRKKLREELETNWEVLAEPIQQVMRKCGIPNGYEKLKDLTRGKKFGKDEYMAFVTKLKMPGQEKERLLRLTPWDYTGLAEELVV